MTRLMLWNKNILSSPFHLTPQHDTMQLLRNDSGHIHIFHFALVMTIVVAAVVIIAHVLSQTNLVATITNLFNKAANLMPRR